MQNNFKYSIFVLKFNPTMIKSNYSGRILLLVLSLIIAFGTFANPENTKSGNQMIVVIDPGHGGKDPGAVNKGIHEKDVVLGIGLKLGKYINENYPDVKVIFTRNTDVFVPLIDRSRIANKNKATLFISIHANFCGTPSTRGTETFVLGLHRSNDNLEVAKKENSVILLEDDYSKTYEGFDPNSPESYIMFEMVQDVYMDQSLSFADDIQQQFKAKLASSNRGVKQAGFLVLRQSSMPSVLIETGFLSNQAEANYLSSEDGQINMARSIFDAFRKFKTRSSGSKPTELAKTNVPETKKQPETQKPDSSVKQEITPVKEEILIASVPDKKPEDKTTETKPSEKAAIQKPETKPVPQKQAEALQAEINSNDMYFSVQIAASTTSVEPTAANFKGLKDVRREKSDKYYRFFVGKESSLEKITPLWTQIKAKFPQAFIVSFVDGKRTIINN
ncbi:MAG: N-acetylmuramoyl-L-alanine amidase [Prolixibacteraceae bacterium]